MWANSTDNEKFGGPEDQYHFSTYDLMVQTALAAEQAQSYAASEWVPAMRAVGSAPGEVCYTYAECLALIRDGVEIDYEGVTGPGEYTDGGMNTIRSAYVQFNEDGSTADPVIFDTDRLLALYPSLTQAECDDDNVCDW